MLLVWAGVSKFQSKSNVLTAEIVWLHHFKEHQLPSCSLDQFYQNIYQLRVIFTLWKLVAILVFTCLISSRVLIWWIIRWRRLVSFYFNWMARGMREIRSDQWRGFSSVLSPSRLGTELPFCMGHASSPASHSQHRAGFSDHNMLKNKKKEIRGKIQASRSRLPLLSCSLSSFLHLLSFFLFSSFFFLGFVYMCSCVYIGMCAGQRLILGVCSIAVLIFLRQGNVSLDLELTDFWLEWLSMEPQGSTCPIKENFTLWLGFADPSSNKQHLVKP